MDCTICGSEEIDDGLVAREMMMGLKEQFAYQQCLNCKSLQIKNVPENLEKYYSKNYYSLQDAEAPNFIERIIKRFRDRYAVFEDTYVGKLIYNRYPKINLRSLSHLELHKDTRILDVGCGKGDLLHSLWNIGFENLTGVDPYISQDKYEINEDVKVIKKDIHQLNGQWDVIMMHHVFEHVANPREVLLSANELLPSGGICLIRTPVADSKAWETYRENWVQLDPPRHLYVHSTKSLACLAQETNFQLKDIIYDSTAFQFWGSIQYENDIPLQSEKSYAVNPEKSMFSAEDIEAFERRAKALNEQEKGDQAVFILQKN